MVMIIIVLLIFSVFWFLPIMVFFINIFPILIVNDKTSKIELLIISAASFIPIINLFLVMAMEENENEVSSYIEKFNKTMKCNSCGIYSKLGRTLIHKDFDGEKKSCPYCESNNIKRTYDNEKSPISESFGFRETVLLQKRIYDYKKLKKEENEILFKDSQLQKYQKIQEEKLAKMMKERGY